jgi:hypothetical protein
MKYFLRVRKLYRNTVPLMQNSDDPVLTIDEALREVTCPCQHAAGISYNGYSKEADDADTVQPRQQHL